ncbi:NACHT domain-containing protein [Micromonospora sp. DT227]|uniref:NACHT domain-containing protein n=1 Tax=Micromonospora sp. DT227 TaxID=3393433 RepID=UPI003CEB902C
MEMPVRIIAANINEQGDLLTRLAADLIFTLGYDNCIFDTHKTGRELDLTATHRFEARNVVAEFKSGATPAGGADLNKFYGVLDAERRRREGREVHGYFISLAGFRSSAIAQEEELGGRFALLDGRRVRDELAEGKIIVGPVRAMDAARQTAGSGNDLELEENPDLIGHAIGWIWAVYFSLHGQRAAVCLVHADGTPLSLTMAKQVAATAKNAKDSLGMLRLLNKAPQPDNRATVKRRYLSFLKQEFGGITLEGLPVDQTMGSGQFKLEALYVPLQLVETGIVRGNGRVSQTTQGDPAVESSLEEEEQAPSHYKLGEVLETHQHLAILGLPGSGKTTALKRIAVAYADKSRLGESADGLPKASWFPVVIKCRHLAGSVRKTILQIIAEQVERAEMPEYRDDFVRLVSGELRNGNLMLLVDGLDEIASSADRLAFVGQLRTFIGVYPKCRLIVTSREAGFRSVAASVNSICHQMKVADLSEESIRTLVVAWHSEVVGKSAGIKKKALDLADFIVETDRVHSLATNPLLLTTLLLVQRWVGQVPRRRSVLYDKAIEVLLMTWNAEGHLPLDPEEAIPQLAYTAYAMMAQGKKTVTLDELSDLLASARRDVPEVLAYAVTPVRDFVDRVEERSSLMTLSGHEVVGGKLKPTYEFKHLTFQEYLAAQAIAERHLDAASRGKSIVEILEDRLDLEEWQEVVTLTAVSSKMEAAQIVARLLERVRAALLDRRRERFAVQLDSSESQLTANLIGCLRDEVQIAPDLAREAIEVGVVAFRYFGGIAADSLVGQLHGGRYDALLRRVCLDKYRLDDEDLTIFGSAIADITYMDYRLSGNSVPLDEWILQRLVSNDEKVAIAGSLALMVTAFRQSTAVRSKSRSGREAVTRVDASIERLIAGLIGERLHRCDRLYFSKMWAAAWALSQVPDYDPDIINALQLKMIRVWRNAANGEVARMAAWVLTSCPLVGSWKLDEVERARMMAFARSQVGARGQFKDFRRRAGLVIHYYLDDSSVGKSLIIEALTSDYSRNSHVLREFSERMLLALGAEGQRVLEELQQRSTRRAHMTR